MNFSVRLFFVLLLVCNVGKGFATPSEPEDYFNYVGVLVDNYGIAIQGVINRNITIDLYSVSTGGTSTYSQTFSNVPIHNGVFELKIGPALPDLRVYKYMGLSVGTTVIADREELVTEAGAIMARQALDSERFSGMTTTELLDLLKSEINLGGLAEVDVAGSQNISNNAITTEKIADNAVTTAKIIDNAITTVKIDTAAVTAEKIADHSVTSDKVSDSAITSTKIAAGAVGAVNIAAGAVSTAAIAAGAITTAKLSFAVQPQSSRLMEISTMTMTDQHFIISDGRGLVTSTPAQIRAVLGLGDLALLNTVAMSSITDSSVTTAKIIDNAITTVKIDTAAVTAEKIADHSVTSDKVSDSAITSTKIAAGAVGAVNIAAGAVSTAAIAAGAVTTAHLSFVPGDLAYVAKGAAGKYLTVDVNGDIAWENKPSDHNHAGTGANSFIGGGSGNTATNQFAAVGGGESNTASGYWSFLGGGNNNVVSGQQSSLVGGGSNTVSGTTAFLGGGYQNVASGDQSFVGGGLGNEAIGTRSAVLGGYHLKLSGSNSAGYRGFHSENPVAASYDKNNSFYLVGVGVCVGKNANDCSSFDGEASMGTLRAQTLTADDIRVGSNPLGALATKDTVSAAEIAANAVTTAKIDATGVGADKYLTLDGDQALVWAAKPTSHSHAGGGADSFIGGGLSNTAAGSVAAVVGGEGNASGGQRSAVVAGYYNSIQGGGHNFIGGGVYNKIGADVYRGSIVGGSNNEAYGPDGFIGGGYNNKILANADYGLIGSGSDNIINGRFGTIGGGRMNSVSGQYTSVLGGTYNNSSGFYASVLGGIRNEAAGTASAILGGKYLKLSGENALGFYSAAGDVNTTKELDNTHTYGMYLLNMGMCVGATADACDGFDGAANKGGIKATALTVSTINGSALGALATKDTVSAAEIAANAVTTTKIDATGAGADKYLTLDGSQALVWAAKPTSHSHAGGGDNSFIGGGLSNTAAGSVAAVVGGEGNASGGQRSAVVAGYYNSIQGGGHNFIGGGVYNKIGADVYRGSIVGGSNNEAYGPDGFIGGGYNNKILANADYGLIGSGSDNIINGRFGTIGGGRMNSVSGQYTSVLGGTYNNSSGFYASVLGGIRNEAAGTASAILGGKYLKLSGENAVGFYSAAGDVNTTKELDNTHTYGMYLLNMGMCVGATADACDGFNGADNKGKIKLTAGLVDGADYSEYFAHEQALQVGDIAGINPQNGLVRVYQSGDALLGVASGRPGILGNSVVDKNSHSVIGLLGQLPFNAEQAVVADGKVWTKDGLLIGLFLPDGNVYINRSPESHILEKRVTEMENKNRAMQEKLADLEQKINFLLLQQ